MSHKHEALERGNIVSGVHGAEKGLLPQSDHLRAQRPRESLSGGILKVSGIKFNGTPKTHRDEKETVGLEN